MGSVHYEVLYSTVYCTCS